MELSSKEFGSSMLLHPPEITRPYNTDGRITLKYRSKRASLSKKELLFNIFSLLRGDYS